MSATFDLEIRHEALRYTIEVRWFSRIKDIKDALHKITKVPPSAQNLFYGNSSIPLRSTVTLHDLGVDRTGHSLTLSIISSTTTNCYFVLNAITPVVEDECAQLLAYVRNGLKRHQAPAKTDVLDCTGGVYFMRSASGKKMAVFKPHDEEQGMPNNPKGYKGNGEHGLREHFKPGYGCMREVAAYLMDINHFCGVPSTLLVHCEHPILNYPARGLGRRGAIFGPSMYPKLGSLQQFVEASDVFEDLGASVFSDLEVQKIALLDLRLFNCDRNATNILAIRKGPMTLSPSISGELDFCFEESTTSPIPPSSMSGMGEGSDRYQLIPIDHGYSLPSKLLINEIDWAWFYYPQVQRPVHEEIKKYVETLDIDAIIVTLQQQVTLSEDSLFLIRVAHQLVVDGIAAGLTLFEIASMVARTDEERASSLERAIEEAEENAHRTIEMRVGSVKRAMPHAFTDDDLVGIDDGLERFTSSMGGKRHRRQHIHDVNSRNNLVDLETDCSTPSTIPKTSPRGRETPANNLVRFLRHSPFNGMNTLRPASSSIDLTNDFTGTKSCHQNEERNERQPLEDESSALRAWTPTDCDDIVDTTTLETMNSPERIDADSHDHGPSDDDEPERDDYDEVDGEEVDQFDQHLGSLNSFRALQGKPLQSIKSLDSVQPLIVSVASLSNASSNERTLKTNKSNKSTGTVDSTDSESSSNGEDKIQPLSHESHELIVPSPVRSHHVMPSNNAFKRLSVTPIRRPSPLQIGSADPLRYQRSNNRKSLDLLDTDGGYNANDEGDTTSPDANDDWFNKSSPLSSPSSLKPPTFLRVTSFSAFSSAPLYDEGSERRIAKLQKEKRRQAAGTEEFHRLRIMFTKNAITTLISKAVKAKTNPRTLIKTN